MSYIEYRVSATVLDYAIRDHMLSEIIYFCYHIGVLLYEIPLLPYQVCCCRHASATTHMHMLIGVSDVQP